MAKVRQKYCTEKAKKKKERSICVKEARTKCLLSGTNTRNIKSCTLIYS